MDQFAPVPLCLLKALTSTPYTVSCSDVKTATPLHLCCSLYCMLRLATANGLEFQKYTEMLAIDLESSFLLYMSSIHIIYNYVKYWSSVTNPLSPQDLIQGC